MEFAVIPSPLKALARGEPSPVSFPVSFQEIDESLEPLTARKNGRISVLKSDAAFTNGPRILGLEAALEREIARLFASPSRAP